MSQFVPPYPERPQEPLPPFAMMTTARRNLLAIFDEKCFDYKFFSTRAAEPPGVCVQQPRHRGAGLYRAA